MTKGVLFTLAIGVACILMSWFVATKFGPTLDLTILDHYFVLSAKHLLIVGLALIVPSLVVLVAIPLR